MTSLETLKETVKRELPEWLESDPAFREAVLGITAQLHPRREETDDKFTRMLDEMRRERLEAERRQDCERWERQFEADEQRRAEQKSQWDANQEELKTQREEQNRKWAEQKSQWDANQAELKTQREEQNRKWEANQAELKALHEESLALGKRIDRGIGALGARWGMRSEQAFRDALAGILEQTFGVKVLNICEFDNEGEVFGRPDIARRVAVDDPEDLHRAWAKMTQRLR